MGKWFTSPNFEQDCTGGASLNWGCLSESTAHDDAILLGDCTPFTLDSYESFVADGRKMEPRGKTPLTIDRLTRCAKQHIEIFCLIYGKEHRRERKDALEVMIELHESQPDLFAISFLCQAWGAMTYAYLAEIKDGTRRMIRMLPDVVKKTDLRRKALSPGPSGRALWEYPTTWLMTHPTGYWQSSVKTKLEERVSRATWKTILNSGVKEKPRVGGEGGAEKTTQEQYPGGIPLSIEEIRASRAFRPLNSAGQALRWDFSSHAGCKAPAGQCTRGVHELMKVTGVHPLIRTHLARRGGHRSEKKIQVEDIDGHVQNLRSSLTEEEWKYKDKDKDKGKSKWVPKAGGRTPVKLLHPAKEVFTNNMATIEFAAMNPDPNKEETCNWRTTVLPTDFAAFDFTPLESDTCALANLSDEWVQHPDDCVPIRKLPTEMRDHQREIDDWWTTGAPQMHPSIVPFVKNTMFTSASDGMAPLTKTQLKEACKGGLRRLIKDGCKADEQHARSAVLLMEQPSDCIAGRERASVICGGKLNASIMFHKPSR